MSRNVQEKEENPYILEFEFQPFTRKHLISYLRDFEIQKEYLQKRQNELCRQLRELEAKKIVNGESIEERIEFYGYGSRGGDTGECGGSNRYNPDTLYNQWQKIYGPFENHRRILICSIMRVLYRQWQLEYVNQCVDLLEPRQRDVIQRIYIQREKVVPYCRSIQMGHSHYNKIKDRALNTLLVSCNQSLSILQKSWEAINVETVHISDYVVPKT